MAVHTYCTNTLWFWFSSQRSCLQLPRSSSWKTIHQCQASVRRVSILRERGNETYLPIQEYHVVYFSLGLFRLQGFILQHHSKHSWNFILEERRNDVCVSVTLSESRDLNSCLKCWVACPLRSLEDNKIENVPESLFANNRKLSQVYVWSNFETLLLAS